VCLNIILLPWIWDKLFLKKYRCGYNYLPALGDMRIAVNYFAFEAFRSKVSLNGEVFFFFFQSRRLVTREQLTESTHARMNAFG